MKFSVTPELALLLKTMRAQSGLSAKSLAERIGRSPSYVSKLENGEVKSVEKGLLIDVVTTLSDGGLFETALPAAMRVLESFMEPSRLTSQAWLLQLDVVERQVSIPAAMAADLQAHLDDAGLDVPGLVRFVNANIETGLGAGFPANQIAAIDYEGQPRLAVRVSLDEASVACALRSEDTTLSYLAVDNIVFSLFRLAMFPDTVGKMPPEQAVPVLRRTASYMEQWGIHSLTGFSHLVSSDEFVARQEPLARSKPHVIDRIAEALEEVAQHDALNAANQLNTFYETLQWDPAFALKLMGIPFSDLGDAGFRTKRQLLGEVQGILDRYEQLPDLEKRLEEY